MGSLFSMFSSKPAPPAPAPAPAPLNIPKNPAYENGNWAYRGGKSRKRSSRRRKTRRKR